MNSGSVAFYFLGLFPALAWLGFLAHVGLASYLGVSGIIGSDVFVLLHAIVVVACYMFVWFGIDAWLEFKK